MRAFALGCTGRARGACRAGGDRQVRDLVAQHGEIAGQTVGEAEFGIGRERGGKALRRIGAVFEVAENRTVEARRRLGG
jgi:hypothetical protein